MWFFFFFFLIPETEAESMVKALMMQGKGVVAVATVFLCTLLR